MFVSRYILFTLHHTPRSRYYNFCLTSRLHHAPVTTTSVQPHDFTTHHAPGSMQRAARAEQHAVRVRQGLLRAQGLLSRRGGGV